MFSRLMYANDLCSDWLPFFVPWAKLLQANRSICHEKAFAARFSYMTACATK